MTLLLTVATSFHTIQVSDRLVTQAGREIDPLANKNIVCVARDGLLSISFTGIAFVRGVPTDEWMALKLLRLEEWDGGMRFGTNPQLAR